VELSRHSDNLSLATTTMITSLMKHRQRSCRNWQQASRTQGAPSVEADDRAGELHHIAVSHRMGVPGCSQSSGFGSTRCCRGYKGERSPYRNRQPAWMELGLQPCTPGPGPRIQPYDQQVHQPLTSSRNPVTLPNDESSTVW